MRKRVLSLCMALALCLSLVPIPVSAGETQDGRTIAGDAAGEGMKRENAYSFTLPVIPEEGTGPSESVPFQQTPDGALILPTVNPMDPQSDARLLEGEDTRNYYSFYSENSVYLSSIPIEYPGEEKPESGVFQVLDAAGEILATSETTTYYYKNNDAGTYESSASFRDLDSSIFELDTPYSIQFVTQETTYPCRATLTIVNGLFVSGVSIYRMFEGDSEFPAELSLYGFRSEEDLSFLKLELLDSDGAVVAASTGAYMITNFQHSRNFIGASFQMRMSDGGTVPKDGRYSLRISSSGPPITCDLSHASSYSSQTVYNRSIEIEDARWLTSDPAVIQVKLSHYMPETEYRISVGSEYDSKDDYGSYTGEIPEDGLVTIPLTLRGQTVDAAQLESPYIFAQYRYYNGQWSIGEYKSINNPYRYSSQGAYFQPYRVRPTAKSVSFSIEGEWMINHFKSENNLLEMRDRNGVVVGTCTELTMDRVRYTTTVTGVINITSPSPLANGTYDLYFNGEIFDTLYVKDEISRASNGSYYFDYDGDTFWTQFGEFRWEMSFFNDSGSGEFVFQRNGADVVSTGTVQGTPTFTDTHSYECVFDAQRMSRLQSGETYTLIFRDAGGEEISLFYSGDDSKERKYDPAPAWPTDSSPINIDWYGMNPGDASVDAYCSLYTDGLRNATVDKVREELMKYSLSKDGVSITAQSAEDLGFVDDDGYYRRSFRLNLSGPVEAGNYQVFYGDEQTRTAYVSGESNQSPYISSSSSSKVSFSASYLPTDKTYTGKFYRGYECLTPEAFPMTLIGSDENGQMLVYSKSVLDDLNLPAGSYSVWIFMDGEILQILNISMTGDNVSPSIHIDGESINGNYYENALVIVNPAGEFSGDITNAGDYHYYRYADSREGLSDAEFERLILRGYFNTTFSDAVTPGPRTFYAELSKSGQAGDAENQIISIDLWFCPGGDFGLSVPDAITGVQPETESYTLTAYVTVPYADVWVGFYDVDGNVAYQKMSYSGRTQDGKSEFSLTIDNPAYGDFYDSHYKDNSRFQYMDTRFVEFFATDLSGNWYDNVSYRGNICSQTVKRFLTFVPVHSIVLPQFDDDNVTYSNANAFTIYGYCAPSDRITIKEGSTTLATVDASSYGEFRTELQNLTEGEHILTVSGQHATGDAQGRLCVDMTPPTISAFDYALMENNRNMVLRWTCDDTDIDHFELYKNETRLYSYLSADKRAQNVATDVSDFTLYAVDFAGNRGSQTLKIEDTENPVARIALDNAQVTVDTEIAFDAKDSTDNFAIASYTWDFGDGSDPVNAAKVSHSYAKVGSYTVTLTVQDYAELTHSATVTVSVVSQAPPTTFTIRNSQTGEIAPNARVTVTDSDGVETSFVSDAQGLVSAILENGVYTVSAISGKLSRLNVRVEVSDERREFTIGMNDDSILKVTTEVKEMSIEEAKAAGINTDAPENRHVYNCTAVFEFGTLEYVYNSGGTVLKSTPLTVGNMTAYAIAKDIYLIVYSQVAWLKELFDVQLLVENTSAFEVIENCVANLNLPDGLSLAVMNADIEPQSASVNLGSILSGGKKSLHWYISGDKEGNYTLNGTVTAARVSENVTDDMSATFTTEKPIEVLAGNAMKLTISAAKTATVGKPYDIIYTLENVSGKTLYNVSLDVLSGKFLKAYSVEDLTYKPTEGSGLSGSLDNGFSIANDRFEPSKKFSGVFTVTFGEGLDLRDGMEYILKDMFTVTGAGSTVTIPTEFAWLNSEPETYQVTFDANGGGGVMNPVTVTSGEGYDLPDNAFTPPDKKTFKAWEIDGKEYAPGDTLTVSADAAVKAIWASVYTVSFDSVGGSQIDPQTVEDGNAVKKPSDPTKNGYSFDAWYSDANYTAVYDFSNLVNHDFMLYAKWSAIDNSGVNDSSGAQGCYVATAVYGSYDCPEVWTLRRFRDNVLAKTWYGRLFIRLYYAVSPTAVKFFGESQWFQNFFRDKLDQMVSKLQSDGFESTPYQDRAW